MNQKIIDGCILDEKDYDGKAWNMTRQKSPMMSRFHLKTSCGAGAAADDTGTAGMDATLYCQTILN